MGLDRRLKNQSIFPTAANKKGKSITTRMPLASEMIGGDDGEDDDVVAENGARFQLMMDHGAKVQKEILLAKLLRLKRVLSSRLHSTLRRDTVGQREAFVVKNQKLKCVYKHNAILDGTLSFEALS